jgi:hypothetical protein
MCLKCLKVMGNNYPTSSKNLHHMHNQQIQHIEHSCRSSFASDSESIEGNPVLSNESSGKNERKKKTCQHNQAYTFYCF